MRLFFWITLLAATFQQVPTGTIEGTVNRAGTRIPIPGVHIKVQGNVAPGRPSSPFLAEVTTDGAGYFMIRDVPGGFGGTIEATREGYLGRTSRARPVTTSVTVYPEQRVQVTNIELIPAATVRGRVVDSADRAIPGLAVDLVRLTTDDRGRRLWKRDDPLGKTNDQGEYQWGALLPGEYYLRAISGVPGAPGVAIYFPGTPDANSAAPIVVREGDDFIADGEPERFQFTRPPGTVFRDARSRDAANVEVTLTRKDLSARLAPPVVDGRGTAMTFPNVPEGDYEISVTFRAQAALNFSRDTDFYVDDVRLAGRSVFDNGIRVGTDAVDSLEIVIGTHGGSIAGTIQGKGNASAQLILIPESFRRNNPALYRRVLLLPRNASGEFLMRGLAPGNYKLFALPETNEPIPFRSPEFAARYEHLAVSVAVQKGIPVGGVQVPFLTTVR